MSFIVSEVQPGLLTLPRFVDRRSVLGNVAFGWEGKCNGDR